MITRRRLRRRLGRWRSCVLLAATLSGAAPAWSADDMAPKFNPPKHYYLALGDSHTYGFQSWKFETGLTPASFNTGYVDVFAARLRAIRPDIDVVNYGCPGESTTSFITGPCLFNALGLPLHDDFGASQLEAATAFLAAHPGQVSPITLQLFGNDMLDLIRACAGDFACIQREAPAAIAQFARRLTVILDRLRQAAPDAEIIVLGGWNGRIDFFAETDPLFDAANTAIASAAADARARFADLVPAFNPAGDVARRAAICSLTLYCADGDGHPSDAGYHAIAEVVFAASDYARLAE